MVKIRLARHGKKGYPFYHIVAADSREPRDGRFIEKLGTYNPNVNPAEIELDPQKVLKWLDCGAQPTETCRTLLSIKGVMLLKHLQGGVKKGAFSQEEADRKFETWIKEKAAQAEQKKEALLQKKQQDKTTRLASESVVKEKRAEVIAKKRADILAAQEAAKVAAARAEENADETHATTEETSTAEA